MSLFNLHTYESLDSTNMLVRERIEANEREGFAALTFEQTAGYGRMGRTWASPAGGLYMSVLLRPNVCSSVLPTISFLVAIAVRRALKHVLAPAQLERVQLKWPNDIVLAGEGVGDVRDARDAVRAGGDDGGAKAPNTSIRRFNKLVGISQELVHGALCIGIGANVFRPAVQQNVTGKNTPVYIAELAQTTDATKATRALDVASALDVAHLSESAQATDAASAPEVAYSSEILHAKPQQQFITHLARLILQELEPAYVAWQSSGFEPFLSEYKRHMCLLGQNIQMQNQLSEQTFEGKVAGINSAGQLLLIDPSGHTKNVTSGEVTLF